MTALRVYILECNMPGCEAVTDYAYAMNKKDAQREARDLGWQTTKRADYCPQHRHREMPMMQRIIDALPD